MRGSQTHLQRGRAAGARRSGRPTHAGEPRAVETISSEIAAEGREYDARQKQKVELVKELNELRKTYDPLRQKLEDLESNLLHLYGWDWVKGDPEEDPYDPHPGYPEGATEEQMQSQDMEDEIDYISVTLDKCENPIQINNQSQVLKVDEIPF